jgi:hypothetical protein
MIRTYAYAEMAVDAAEGPIARDKLPYGCNFGFRRSRLGSAVFDPRLGVVGDQRIHGEETAFMEGILDGGGAGRWVPGAVVHHWIPPERTTWPYVLQYFMGMGRTRVRQSGPSQAFGAPGAAGAAASYLLRAGVARARRRPTWVGNACLAAVAWGELAEMISRRQLR